MMSKLGIIAGGGALPLRLVELCQRSQRPYVICALDGFADAPFPENAPMVRIRLGSVGELFSLLRAQGVTDVVLAGAVRRPSLSTLRPDWRGAKFLARIGMRAWGDDGLLRAVVKEFEEEGFRVVGAHDLLEGLLAPAGVMTRVMPDEQARIDIRRGLEAARELGRLDIGQAVVVQQGMILGVEAAEGTDGLLERCRTLCREGPGGVLVKICKPGQETRADLPTIGVQTLDMVAGAGLRGIAIHAGQSVILDLAAVVVRADSLGLFIIGVDASS